MKKLAVAVPIRLQFRTPQKMKIPLNKSVSRGTRLPQRRHPAKGVFISLHQPIIVFLTVCTQHRRKGLANHMVHDALIKAWNKADLWIVGAYMIMPDHLHLFCSPTHEESLIEPWITFWKREFRREFRRPLPKFQIDGFHHRLRNSESYAEKWEYVRQNPVRAGLVKNAEDWPYQGILHELRW